MNKLSVFCLMGMLWSVSAQAQLPANPWDAEEFDERLKSISVAQKKEKAALIKTNISDDHAPQRSEKANRVKTSDNTDSQNYTKDIEKLQKKLKRSVNEQKRSMDNGLREARHWKDGFVRDCKNKYRSVTNTVKNTVRNYQQKINRTFSDFGRQVKSLMR